MKNDIYEILNIKGFDVEVFYCDYAENPIEWETATLVTAHRKYTFGGVQLSFDASSIDEAFAWHLADNGLTYRDILWLPVYMYDHSGIALATGSFNDPWDSGQLGFIYEPRANIRAEYGVKRISSKLEAHIYTRMRSAIEVLESWANGAVFGYCIPALDDRCGGYYGWDHNASGLLEAATDVIDYHLKQIKASEIQSSKDFGFQLCPV